MILRFPDALLPYTCGHRELAVSGATIVQALKQLFCSFPQLYVHLVDNKGGEARRYALVWNDSDLLEGGDALKPCSASDVLEFVPLPSGAYGVDIAMEAANLAMIIGTSFETAMTVYTVVSTVVQVALMVAVSMALSAIMGALVDDIAAPDASMGVTNSAAYTFDGVKNTTYSGATIAIVYGEHRVGGNLLNVYTRTNTNEKVGEVTVYSNSVLLQIGLCEGEVHSVSDVWVNKLPLSYYNGVSPPEVCLGSETQAPMDSFERTESTTTITRKITNPSEKVVVPVLTSGTPLPVYGYVDLAGMRIVEGYYKIAPNNWVSNDQGGV